MEWLAHNFAPLLLGVGLVLLILDMVVFGFATFILTFLGLSFLLTGLAMWLGLLPATFAAALWSNAVLTAVLAAVLWRPLQKLQNTPDRTSVHHDFADQQFLLADEVDDRGLTQYYFSGVHWKLKSRQPISKNTLVRVVKVDVGVLWVQPINTDD